MKKTFQVLALTAVLVFAFATVASAKYASYDNKANYLSWTGANVLYNAINGTTGATQANTSPHGGYTQTSVKCAVCHSTHRAFSGNTDAAGVTTARTTAGLGSNYFLTNGSTSCVACHASWGANPSKVLVEVGTGATGPHIGTAGSTCTQRGCHGSMHGMHASKYAAVKKYNLTNEYASDPSHTGGINIDTQLDNAIAAGNVNSEISLTSTSAGMKAFVTGYTCSPCHSNSQFAVATFDETSNVTAAVSFGGEVTSAATSPTTQVMRTGHPSAGGGAWVPNCEACHDLVGVATKTTAFPHANKGISVYANGRYNYETANYGGDGYSSVSNPTAGATTEQYGLWMTSNASDAADSLATPIAGASTNGFNLQDGACIKCHSTSETAGYPLP